MSSQLPWKLFDLAGVMLLGLGTDGRCLYINERGVELLGRTREEIVGSDWITTFVPDRIRERVREVFAAVMAEKADIGASFENPILCADGSERIISWRNTVLREPGSGRIIAALSSGEDVTELRQAEARLAESEARLRATFEQAVVGLAQLSLDGRFLRCNDRFCEIVGLPCEALRSRTFLDVTHADDTEPGLTFVHELVAGTRDSFRLEQRYVRPDGTVVWGDLTASVVRKPDGQPAHLFAILEDITTQRRVEELSSRAELQRLAFRAAMAGVFEWDAASDLMTWSPELHALFGFGSTVPTYAEWLGRCVDPRDLPLFSAVLEAAAAGEEAFAFDFRSPGPDGVRWMSTMGRLIVDDAGKPVRAHGIIADVTRRVRTEEALRDSEERLRLALEAGRIGVWDWDVSTDRITWSQTAVPAAALASDVQPDTLQDWLSVVHPADRDAARAKIDAALAGEETYQAELRLSGSAGRPIWIETRASVVREPDGRPVRMIGIDRDITAEKDAVADLRTLAAEYDHRTRNVFQVVNSLVVQSLSPGAERERLLGRLNALFRAHAAAGEGLPSDIDRMVRRALAPYPPERVAVHGPSTPVSDRTASTLALVFHELATNAAKYGALSGEAGRLDVEWRIDEPGGAPPRLLLTWTENACSHVAPPQRKGFGTLLLNKSLARALHGTVDFDYSPTGLTARLTIPVSAIASD